MGNGWEMDGKWSTSSPSQEYVALAGDQRDALDRAGRPARRGDVDGAVPADVNQARGNQAKAWESGITLDCKHIKSAPDQYEQSQ